MAATSVVQGEQKKINPFMRYLSNIEKVGSSASGIIILVMMISTTLDVAMRTFFNHPIQGNYEFQEIILACVAFMGVSYIQSQRTHISMDLVPERLSASNKLALQVLADVIFLFIGILVTWQMGKQAWLAWTNHDFLWGIVHFPTWPPKLIITLGMGVLSIRLIADIIKNPIWRNRDADAKRFFRLAVMGAILVVIILAVYFTKNMDLAPQTVGWLAVLLFLVFLFAGVPVAGAMALIGIYGIWLMKGSSSALGLAATVPFTATSTYELTVLPLFILMGSFAALAGFAQAGFEMARRWLEGMKGGVAQATVIGAAAFAAATGSGVAACAILAKVAIPEMLKNGVKKGVAIGIVASASSLAVMIPPSNMFVVYGMLTGTSIGKLLISGIIPGIIAAAMIMLVIFLIYQFDKKQARSVVLSHSTWKERWVSIPKAWGLVFIALVIIGGIYTGVFTPTEAGAIGAFAAFLTVIITRKAGWRAVGNALIDTGGISCTILLIIVGGMIFGSMISVTRLPIAMTEWIVGLKLSPLLILIVIIIIYILLGCFLDTLSTMIITLPIIFPVIIKLGFSPIWFGVLMVQNAEIGAITPPYGMNLFILKRILPNTTMAEIMRGVALFILPVIATMAIYIAFPQVTLWLPNMMSK